ncbi:MAG: ABC transporter permease [bacterium]
MWIATPHFLTFSNIVNVVQQSSINAVIAVGMTFVILTTGIDLSVGSLLALSGVLLAAILHQECSMLLAIPAALGIGSLCGVINGVLISWGNLPPFIVTLGMMSAARGAALVFTQGRPISGFDESFRALATDSTFHIPNPVILMLLLYALAYLVLQHTRFGRHTYAIGSNEEATLLSGVPVKVVKTLVYALSGLTSALAAVLLTARLNSAQPTAGYMYELDAIAAVVIGGTSLKGGEGTILGTLIGALIIGVLRNGLNLLEVSAYTQNIVIGSVIVISALLDSCLKSPSGRRG